MLKKNFPKETTDSTYDCQDTEEHSSKQGRDIFRATSTYFTVLKKTQSSPGACHKQQGQKGTARAQGLGVSIHGTCVSIFPILWAGGKEGGTK